MSSPPLERRSRNAPILNPFDQLDAASFDSFVTDVAAAIRNALNPSLPPAPIAKSSHVQAIAPSLDVAGSGESVNGRHLVMLDPSSNVTPSPAPSSVVDTEATEEDTFIRQKFQFKHTTYNLPLSSTRSQEFSNTGLQLKDLNQTNDASSNYSRASKTETPKQRSRSPSVIDLVSDSDDEAESAKPTPTSETVPVRQSPYQRATPEGYVGDAAAETEANVSSEGESMKSGSGKDAVYRRPEVRHVGWTSDVELDEVNDSSEGNSRNAFGEEDEDEEDIYDTFTRQLSRRNVRADIKEHGYARDEDEEGVEKEEEEGLRTRHFFANDDEEGEEGEGRDEDIEYLPDFRDSAYEELEQDGHYNGYDDENMSRSSLPPVQNSKGKGRALDEGPGVEALHGISQRMEKHPELYTPMYIFSAGAAVRRRSTSTEEDDSGASYGTSEEEVDELDEEDVQKREYFYRGRGRARSDEGSDIYLSGDASSPPWEVLGGEPGDAEDQDEEEEEAQEEQGVEEEEQGEDQADQEVEGEDEDGEEEGGEGYEGDEDEDEDDGLEARTVESPKAEEAETVPGRGASDPIIIDDDEEPMIERVPAGSPMYVELRHTSQNSGEVEDLSLLHTMVAAQEDHQPFSPAQSTPLFGDFTDSQPMSEHEDHQSQEHNNDLNGEGGFGPKTLQMDGDWPNDLQGAIGIFRHETDSQHVSLPADLIVPSLHRVADEGIPDPLANDATEHPEVPPKPDSNALSPEMSMFVEASGATTDDAIIAATSPRPQLVPLTGAIAAIANASGDRPDSPEGTVAGASKSALVFSPLVDFPTPLFAGDVYASGPVLPPGFIVEDSEPLSTYDLFQQHLSSSSEPDNEETCIQKQLSGEGIQLGDVVDSGVDDHHAVGESLIGDIYLPRSQLSDGVSSPGADELNEQRDFVHGSAVVPAPDLHQLGNLGGEIKRAGEPPSFLNADRFLSPADVLVPPNNPVPLTSPHLYHADIGSGDSNVVVQINQTRQPSAAPAADMETHAQLDTEIPNPNGNKDVYASDGHHDLADTPPAPPTLPDPFIPPTQLSIPDIEDTHLLRVPEHDAPEGSVVDSVTAEPPSTCGESPDTKFSEDIGRRHDNPPDSHGMKTEQRDGTRATNETDATAVHASVGTSGVQEIKGFGHVVPVRLSSKGNVPIADKNTFEVEAGPTQDDLTPDAADDNIKLSHANEGKLTLLVTNGETPEELGKRDLSGETLRTSELSNNRARSGLTLIPEISIPIFSSSHRPDDAVSGISPPHTPLETGSTTRPGKRKRSAAATLNSPALNTRSKTKDVAETSSQASFSSPPVSTSSQGSGGSRHYILARQLGHPRPQASISSTHSSYSKPQFRPYVSIPPKSSFHHHKNPASERALERGTPASPTADLPLTRSQCRFHKVSASGTRPESCVYLVIPGCSLGATTVMEEESIVDCGIATNEDNARKITDLSKIEPHLISIFRKLVGPDAMNEGVCGYLPDPAALKAPLSLALPTETVPDRASNVPPSMAKRKNRFSAPDVESGEEEDGDSTLTISPTKRPERRTRRRKPRRSNPHSDLADYQPSSDESPNAGYPPKKRGKRARLHNALSSPHARTDTSESSPVDLAGTALGQEETHSKGPGSDPDTSRDDFNEPKASSAPSRADTQTSHTIRRKRKRQPRDPGSLAYRPGEDEESEPDKEELMPKSKRHRQKPALSKAQPTFQNGDADEPKDSPRGEEPSEETPREDTRRPHDQPNSPWIPSRSAEYVTKLNARVISNPD